MNLDTQDPGDEAAELLLDLAAGGNPSNSDPLLDLLAAARASDPDRALAGEQAALAAFRDAQRSTTATAVRRTRVTRFGLAGAVAATLLAGAAYGAERAGVPLPFRPAPVLHTHQPSPSHPNPSPSPTATSTPVGSPSPDRPGKAKGQNTHAPKDVAKGHGQNKSLNPGQHKGLGPTKGGGTT